MRYGKKFNYFGCKEGYCKVFMCNFVFVIIEYKCINMMLAKVKVFCVYFEFLVIKVWKGSVYDCCVVFSYL